MSDEALQLCFLGKLGLTFFLSRLDIQYAPYAPLDSGHFSDNFDAHTEIQILKGLSLILIL